MRANTNRFIGLDLDHRTQTKGIYRLVGQGHKGWSRHVDRELGNYDYLLGADVSIRLCLHVLPHLNVRLDWSQASRCGTGFAWMGILDSWSELRSLVCDDADISKTTGATGFRLDAIKHIDYRFIAKFVRFLGGYKVSEVNPTMNEATIYPSAAIRDIQVIRRVYVSMFPCSLLR